MLVVWTCLMLLQAPAADVPAHEWRQPKPPAAAKAAPAPVEAKQPVSGGAGRAGAKGRPRGAGADAKARGGGARRASAGAEAAKDEEAGASVAGEDASEAKDASGGAEVPGATSEAADPGGDGTTAGADAASEGSMAKAAAEPAAGAVAEAVPAGIEREAEVASARRKGRAQMFAGAALASVGVVGLGVMAGGLYVSRFSEQQLARGTGYPDELLAPLRAQHDRGETMLAAGAVTAAFGAALGVALMVTGSRELKADRAARWARVQVAPSLGGLVVGGRF